MDLTGANWRKSSRSSGNGGACVEATPCDCHVAVRDSKNPQEAALTFNRTRWAAFAREVKSEAFDRAA